MTHTVHIELGTAAQLLNAFSFSPGVSAKSPAVLKDAIEHSINQTLLRDLCYSAWAVVQHQSPWKWEDDDRYSVRITSPHHDISRFEQTLPGFLSAIQLGHDIYESQQDALEKQREKLIEEGNKDRSDTQHQLTKADFESWYLPPFGLSMINTNCIQLLHYPPASTITYMDYLYSPTNRRWENLLGYNDYPGAENSLCETIVDIAPIAASGGARGGALIEPLLENDVFGKYAQTQLKNLLRPSKDGKTTQPIVAYGTPVGVWLARNYGDELKAQKVKMVLGKDGKPKRPQTCAVFTLQLQDKDGPATPVMCANHPIKFNYYDKDFKKALGAPPKNRQEQKKLSDRQSAIVLSQDLIAAGWQGEMAQKWESNTDADLYKKVALSKIKQWNEHGGTRFNELLEIFREQVDEFSLSDMPEVDTDAWEQLLKESLQDKI